MNNHKRTFNFPATEVQIKGKNLTEFDVELTCDPRDLYDEIDVDDFCAYHSIERQEE